MKASWAVLTVLALGGTGCGTLKSLSGGTWKVPGPAIYGGIRVNAAEMHHNTAHHPCYACFFCADMPFSFVLDTILLPVTVPIVLFRTDPAKDTIKDLRRRMEAATTMTVRFTLEKEAPGTAKVVAKGTLLLKRGNKIRLELTVKRDEQETPILFISDGKRMRTSVGSSPPVIADAPEGMEEWYRAVLYEVGVLENHWLPPGNVVGLTRGDPVRVAIKTTGPLLYSSSSTAPRLEAAGAGVKTETRELTLDQPPIRCTVWRTYDGSTLVLLGQKLRLRDSETWVRETYDEFRYDDEIPDDRFTLPE